MYKDEYGNVWASYDNYQTYLRESSIEKSDNKTAISKLLEHLFKNIYIDDECRVWESKQKYIESGNRNE